MLFSLFYYFLLLGTKYASINADFLFREKGKMISSVSSYGSYNTYSSLISNKFNQNEKVEKVSFQAKDDSESTEIFADNTKNVDENYSSFRLNGLKNQALVDVLNEKGLSNSQIDEMAWSEKVVIKSEISDAVQSKVKSAVRTDVMESQGTGFLRGEQLSNEVVSTLLLAI